MDDLTELEEKLLWAFDNVWEEDTVTEKMADAFLDQSAKKTLTKLIQRGVVKFDRSRKKYRVVPVNERHFYTPLTVARLLPYLESEVGLNCGAETEDVAKALNTNPEAIRVTCMWPIRKGFVTLDDGRIVLHKPAEEWAYHTAAGAKKATETVKYEKSKKVAVSDERIDKIITVLKAERKARRDLEQRVEELEERLGVG